MRRPIDSTGWVIRSTPTGPKFAGTCFGYRGTGYLLTAAHCVADATERDLSVSIMLDHVEQGVDVESVRRHPTADVAIIRITDAIEIFEKFTGPRHVPDLGADVAAFGYPEDTGGTGVLPTARYFKGHVQRRMLYKSYHGYEYAAAELSFGAPGGLSGGPVVLQSSPSEVIGIVTENKRSTTYLETVTDVVDGDTRYREEVHSTINYGVCVLLEAIRGWLHENVPSTPGDARRGMLGELITDPASG